MKVYNNVDDKCMRDEVDRIDAMRSVSGSVEEGDAFRVVRVS